MEKVKTVIFCLLKFHKWCGSKNIKMGRGHEQKNLEGET